MEFADSPCHVKDEEPGNLGTLEWNLQSWNLRTRVAENLGSYSIRSVLGADQLSEFVTMQISVYIQIEMQETLESHRHKTKNRTSHEPSHDLYHH